jgi:hypothetical protein
MSVFSIERLINTIDTLSDEEQEQIRKHIANNQRHKYDAERFKEFANAEEAGTDLLISTYKQFGEGFIHIQYEEFYKNHGPVTFIDGYYTRSGGYCEKRYTGGFYNTRYQIPLKSDDYFDIYTYLDMYETRWDNKNNWNVAIGLTDKPRNDHINKFKVIYESPKWLEYKSDISKEKRVILIGSYF